jgi:uncharacterized protein (DUF2132 family)
MNSQAKRQAPGEPIDHPIDHPNDPLHGVTLERILTRLVDYYGWAELARVIDINCFKTNPSIKSSLTFLRRTPWARKQLEDFYLSHP